MASGRGGATRFASSAGLLAAIALLLGAGCATPAPPPPQDITGSSATFVRYAEAGGEEIEVRGLRYRHAVVTEGGGPADRRRDETRRMLSRDQLARVLAWAGKHDALTLTSPTGSHELPTLASPPPITLEVAVGESAIGIGWAEGSAWSDPAMAERVHAAVAALRLLAGEIDRSAQTGAARGAAMGTDPASEGIPAPSSSR